MTASDFPRVLPDHCIHLQWICPECSEETSLMPSSLQDLGSPICRNCDCDMDYRHTIVALPQAKSA